MKLIKIANWIFLIAMIVWFGNFVVFSVTQSPFKILMGTMDEIHFMIENYAHFAMKIALFMYIWVGIELFEFHVKKMDKVRREEKND